LTDEFKFPPGRQAAKQRKEVAAHVDATANLLQNHHSFAAALAALLLPSTKNEP
jgi:hypothetical protein